MTATVTVHSIKDAIVLVNEALSGRRTRTHIPILYLPGNAGRIEAIETLLFERPALFTGGNRQQLYVFQTLALGPADGWERAVLGGIIPVTPFIGPGVRSLVNEGLAEYIRTHLSRVHTLFEGRWRPDVAIAHVSRPDDRGRVTLGLNAGFDIAAVMAAPFRVAVMNMRMPRWHIEQVYDPQTNRHYHTGCAMALTDFDVVVPTDEPLCTHRMAPKDETIVAARRIADHIIEFLLKSVEHPTELPHTLQLGIGAIPNAVAHALAERRLSVRGVWSEMFSDGVRDLYEHGLIRASGGEYLRDRIVVGFVLGDEQLYACMHGNPHFAIMPQELVNDPCSIGRNPSMASINSALAVSLGGEVCAATIGPRYHSGVGGQYDFAHGALRSPGGVAFIAMPSTVRYRDGSVASRIVPIHDEGAHHTIPANLPVIVVTEQGVADLRSLTDQERAAAMLNVAHPDFVSELGREVRQLPALQGAGVIRPRLVTLFDGACAIVRPATRGDIPHIVRYIESLSPDDRYTRYMGSVTVHALTNAERLNHRYDASLDYDEHAAFIVIDRTGSVMGVVHAHELVGEDDVYEVSFSRRSDQEGQGIGAHLMDVLIDWAEVAGVKQFHAVTYRTNSGMCDLFDRYGFTKSCDPDDPSRNVCFHAVVEVLVAARARARG